MKTMHKLYGYETSEKLVQWVAKKLQMSGVSLRKLAIIVYGLGIVVPIPLLLKDSSINFGYWLSPILLLLFMILEGAFDNIRSKTLQKSYWFPYSRFFIFILWYQFVLGEAAYSLWKIEVIRYLNLLVLLFWVVGWLLIMISLKQEHKSLGFYNFILKLEGINSEYQKKMPFNYIGISLFFMKKDRILIAVLVASAFGLLALYLLFFLASLTFLSLIGYTLFLFLYIKPEFLTKN